MTPAKPFTDSDLKWLKEHLDGDCYLSTEWTDARKMMPGLIERLEAAEAYVNHACKCVGCPKCTELEMTWRKECGK